MEYLPTFTIIYPINEPNVGKYTIHGASGYIQPLKMIEPCNPIGFAKTALFFIREKRFVACDRCNLCQIPTTTVQMRSWSWSPMENTFLGEDLGRFGSVKNPVFFFWSQNRWFLDVPINGTSRIWIYFYGRSKGRFLLWEILTIFIWMSLVSLDELTRVPRPCRVTGLGIWGSEHQRAHPNCEPHGSGHLLLDVGPVFSLCNSSLFHTHWLFFSHLYIPK